MHHTHRKPRRPLAAAIAALFDKRLDSTFTVAGTQRAAALTLGAALGCAAVSTHAQTAPAQAQPAADQAQPQSAPAPAVLAQAQAAPAQPGTTGKETTLPAVEVHGSSVNDEYTPGVTSIGHVETPIRDVPQSITVINRAVMDAQAASSLTDVLRNVPGITLGAAEGGTIGNNINLRGFSARTDLYLDGMRDRGQYYRDVFALDSVEVLKGPSSMLFGRGSTGGVINQVSKVPSLTEKNEVSVTAGTQPGLRTTVDLNHPLSDTSAFRLNMMAQDVDSTRDVMQNKDFGFAPSLRLGIGTPTEITLSAFLAHNTDMPDYGLPPVNGQPAAVNHDNFYGLTDDRTIQDVQEFSARIRHKIAPGLTFRNQTQYAHYTIDVRETGPNNVGFFNGAGVFTFITPTGGTPTGNATPLPNSSLFVQLASHDRKIDDSGLYNQSELLWEVNTGSIKHSILAGLELGHDSYRNQAYTRSNLPIVSLTNPAELATPANSVSTAGSLADASATTFAPYINDTMELTKQWKAVAGLRWDRYKAGISNSVPSATTPASASQTVDFTSVRSGLIYQPTDAQSYYVSYGTSFDPSLETLTVTAGQQSLAPEKNRSYEAGAKWDLAGGNLSVTSAVFEVDKTNAKQLVSTGVYALVGNIRVRGWEVNTVGRLTSKWQVLAGYTHLDAKIVSAVDGTQGNVPANVPKDSATLWSTYKLTPEWEVGGGGTYMSNRFANNQDVVSSGNYLRYDATVAYHQPRYDLRLNMLNLTNRVSYEQLMPSDQGRSVPTIDRTVLATVTYHF